MFRKQTFHWLVWSYPKIVFDCVKQDTKAVQLTVGICFTMYDYAGLCPG